MFLLKPAFRFFLVLFVCCDANAQTRVVELIVFADNASQAGDQHAWVQILSEVGVDRVSSVVRSGVRPSIDEEKFGGSTIVRVKGVLMGGRLLLPGRKFARSDVGRIKRYLQKLKHDPAEVAMAEKRAFGLTDGQLREVHTMLSREINTSTHGLSVIEAVENILHDTNLDLRMDTDVRVRLATAKDLLLDEHNGISVGTALASIFNECGLALLPKRFPGRKIQLHVVDQRITPEAWPIGWPSKQAPVILEPRLFQKQDIRIERFPLGDALTAVGKRCGATLLYNRPNISKHGIDLEKTESTFIRKHVSYMVALGKLLRQSEPPMDIEIRVDEAGNPFVWIDVRN